jgi:DNA ligase 1
MKPMLADDYIESKLRFPVIAQPKIDGVRGLNLNGKLTGRSLKFHKNLYTTNFFSHPRYYGMDGELAAEAETHPDLCRLTTSAVSTIAGEPWVLWHVFDLVNDQTRHMPYCDRLVALKRRIEEMTEVHRSLYRVAAIKSVLCNDAEALLHQDTLWLAQGYEGTIIRDPHGLYKEGRSTPTEGGLLRIKRFADGEAVVLSVEEGETNNNEATVGLLGQTERSTHQANMVPNGMVGRLICKDVKTGETITVAPGRMVHSDRERYFLSPELIVGQTIKYKHFLKGVKDKPRFPTFQCIRAASDIGTDE